jgi:hypothetical protein
MDILFFVITAAAIVALSLWNGYRRAKQIQRLVREGLPVSGRITWRGNRRGKAGQRSIRYEYSVRGEKYTGRSALSRAQYSACAEGDAIALHYLPSEPRVAAPQFTVDQSPTRPKNTTSGG